MARWRRSPWSPGRRALEAFSDTLRREVGPQGVHVVSVEPGGIRTPVWDKSRAEAERTIAAMPADARRRYDSLIAGILRQGERLAREGLPPEAVASVIGKALTARRPRARYVVGREAQVQVLLARLLPDRAFDRFVARALR